MGILPSDSPNPNTIGGYAPYTWGIDVTNLNPSIRGSVAFFARKPWLVGFQTDASDIGFQTVSPNDTTTTVGFVHKAHGNIAFQAYEWGEDIVSFSVKSTGQIELGRPGGTTEPLIDFKKEHAEKIINIKNKYIAIYTAGNGIYIIDNKGRLIRKIDSKTGLKEDIVENMFVDSQNNLWLAHGGGLSRIAIFSNYEYYIYYINYLSYNWRPSIFIRAFNLS